jgi:hypothetical protein
MKRLITLALIFALLLSLLGCQKINDSDNTDNFNKYSLTYLTKNKRS